MDYTMERAFDEEGGCWRVALSGELDIFNSAELKTELTALLDERPGDLFINCEGLGFIDSTALGALVSVFKRVKSGEKELHLTALKPNVLKLFRITNLDKIMNVQGGEEDE
jgi:anti-sigma B factor antagonist